MIGGGEVVEQGSEAAAEAFYESNTVEEEPGKFRCPLSGKLFKSPTFVRKHIDNKHGARLKEAQRIALDPKYAAYYMAAAQRSASMPEPPPRRPAAPAAPPAAPPAAA